MADADALGTALAVAARLVPSLLQLNSNAGVGSTGSDYWNDAIFANGVDAPDWSALENLTRSAARFIGPNCRLIVGVRLGRAQPRLRLNVCPDYAAVEAIQFQHLGIEVGSENGGLAIWDGVPERVSRPQWRIKAAVQERSILSSASAETGRTSCRKA